MPPRVASTKATKGGQEAPTRGATTTSGKAADLSLLSPALKAYYKQQHHKINIQKFICFDQARSDETPSIPHSSPIGFYVASAVDLSQHENAFFRFDIYLSDETSSFLSFSQMQEEEEKLKDEVTHMLPQLQPPHPGEKGTERNLAHLALKLIAAEFRRKSGSHSPPGTSSGDGLPSKPAMFKSRFVIDRLIRQLLSTPYFPKILKLSPTEGERILRLRCAIAKGRQIVSFQGSESASILLKELSIQNHPEAKVVIQAPFDDEAEAGAAFVRPNGSTASSEDLLLYMALSFDVKGLVIEPRSTKTVVVRTNPSSSPIDQATFYTILGGIKEELMESWDSVCVLVVKGGEGCDDKDEMRAKLRALAICMRALHDIKALDRMACCIVKKCTSEQEAQGGLVAIILAECDLRRNNRGLALMPSPTVVENQNRMHVAPIARGGRGGGDDDQRLIREALTKLEGVEDTYKQLVGDLGGYDGFYGRGAAKALKEKFAQLSRQTLL